MIKAGKSSEEIKAMWHDDVEKFREQRSPYLLYEDISVPLKWDELNLSLIHI